MATVNKITNNTTGIKFEIIGSLPDPYPVEWGQNPTIDTAEDNTIELNAFNAERKKILTDSDYTQLSDSPLSTSDKSSWATYRQELRDMPQQSGFDPINLTWPTQP